MGDNKAPAQQEMDIIDQSFGQYDSMLVKQTMRGCLQECLGCEAKSEFKVSGMDWGQLQEYRVSEQAMNQPDALYAIENSSCFCRLCWRDGRPFNMAVSQGGDPGGQGVVNYVKPCGFPLWFSIPTKDGSVDCPCCCLLPMVETQTPSGGAVGNSSHYICDINLYVPKLKYKENGQDIYVVKPETCCGGCCISCNCLSGKGCVYIPFYFHDPQSGEPIGGYTDQSPQIRKVFAGFKKECCSTADTFAVKFPPGIDAKRKAGLLGMTFLLDFTVFERQQEKEGVG